MAKDDWEDTLISVKAIRYIPIETATYLGVLATASVLIGVADTCGRRSAMQL
jgi:hypothetical protein